MGIILNQTTNSLCNLVYLVYVFNICKGVCTFIRWSHTHVCVCVCVRYMCTSVPIHMEAQGYHQVSLITLHYIDWSRVPQMSTEITDLKSLARQLTPAVLCLCFLCIGITKRSPHPLDIYMGTWDLNSGSCICVENIYPQAISVALFSKFESCVKLKQLGLVS